MDGKGRAKDNIYIERFCRTVKYDYAYLRPVENRHELYAGLNAYIHRYNHKGIRVLQEEFHQIYLNV